MLMHWTGWLWREQRWRMKNIQGGLNLDFSYFSSSNMPQSARTAILNTDMSSSNFRDKYGCNILPVRRVSTTTEQKKEDVRSLIIATQTWPRRSANWMTSLKSAFRSQENETRLSLWKCICWVSSDYYPLRKCVFKTLKHHHCGVPEPYS